MPARPSRRALPTGRALLFRASIWPRFLRSTPRRSCSAPLLSKAFCSPRRIRSSPRDRATLRMPRRRQGRRAPPRSSKKTRQWKTMPPVIAVVDTGVDYTNPALVPSMVDLSQYPGLMEDTGCGKYGIDATVAAGDPAFADPMDLNSHGTHVAGIIAANGDVKGVNPHARIVACVLRFPIRDRPQASPCTRAASCTGWAGWSRRNVITVSTSRGSTSPSPVRPASPTPHALRSSLLRRTASSGSSQRATSPPTSTRARTSCPPFSRAAP